MFFTKHMHERQKRRQELYVKENCAGFVADVFQQVGADLNKIDTDNYNHYINAYNWHNTAYFSDCITYRFNSISSMLSSGVLEKGDLIYFEPDRSSYGADCHIGFFWGDSYNDDKFWHSAKGQGNAITNIKSVSPYSYVYVYKTRHFAGDWSYEDGSWYYIVDGDKVTGWQYINNKWYYMHSDGKNGVKVLGWADIGSDRFYFDETTGLMYENQWVVDKNYFYDDSIHDWENELKSKAYYLKDGGYMAKGWLLLREESWYYFDADGKKVMNTWIDGYYLGEYGEMVRNGWIKNGNDIFFVGMDGRRVEDDSLTPPPWM